MRLNVFNKRINAYKMCLKIRQTISSRSSLPETIKLKTHDNSLLAMLTVFYLIATGIITIDVILIINIFL